MGANIVYVDTAPWEEEKEYDMLTSLFERRLFWGWLRQNKAMLLNDGTVIHFCI